MRSGFLASLPYPDPAQALTAPVARNVLCEIRSEPLIAEGKIGSLAKVRHLAQNVVLRRYDRELRIGSHSQQRILFIGCILLGGPIATEQLGSIWDNSLHHGQARREVGLCERR